MVLEHIKNNLEIRFNDGKAISLRQGMVKLGHETKVVFEVVGIPSEIRSVYIKNTAFKDISRNQNAFLLFKDGFAKDQFVLNQANAHTLQLNVSGNTFVETGKSRAGFFSPYLGLASIGLLGIGYVFLYFLGNKKTALKVIP